MSALITVTSGKAQAGKSFISANLAYYLAHKGHAVALLTICGQHDSPWQTKWPNLIAGRESLTACIQRTPVGIDILALPQQLDLPDTAKAYLTEEIKTLNNYTYLIIDLSAVTCPAAIACCLTATETLLVLTTDSASLSTGFEWLSLLKKHGFRRTANLIFNQIRKPALAQAALTRFRDLAQKRLNLNTNLWGTIAWEEGIQTDLNQSLAEAQPDVKALRDIQSIGHRILAELPPENQTLPLSTFWRKYTEQWQLIPAPAEHQTIAEAIATQTDTASAATPEITPDAAPDTMPNTAIDNSPPKSQGDEATQDSKNIERISQSLEKITNELKLIRKLLENQLPTATARSYSDLTQTNALKLDFEHFLARQENKS